MRKLFGSLEGKNRFWAINICCVITFGSFSSAERISVEDFFKEPYCSDMSLSPDGEYVAFLSPLKDVRTVFTNEIDTGKYRGLQGDRTQDVTNVEWAGNEHIVFSLIKNNIYANGLYSAKRGSPRSTRLNRGDVIRIVDPLKNDPDHVLVWIVASHGQDEVLLKYNIHNGWTKSAGTKIPEGVKVLGWRTKRSGEIYGVRVYDDGDEYLLHRNSEGEPWVSINPTEKTDLIKSETHGFDEEKNAYYVVGYKTGEETASLYLYFLDTHSLSEPLFVDENYDIYDNAYLRYCPKAEKVVGMRYVAKGLRNIWFDPDYQALQAMIDRSLTETINLISKVDDHLNRLLIYAYSDRQPGVYLCYDISKQEVVFSLPTRAWINPDAMARQNVIEMKMRDGLRLEGYVTLPGPQSEGPFPMVTLAHGGPWARDAWSFDPIVQFLANRGYAVLQLNFRGSTGYSRRVTEEHSGDFRGMIDDLSEATRMLVSKGIADPDRLAIMGSSFGGYAAVASAAFDPELYKCAISINGTFDMEGQIKNWRSRFWKKRQGTSASDFWIETLGDPEKESEYLKSISPLYHTEDIEIPLLLVAGKSDKIVSSRQTRKLAKELRLNGNEPLTIYLSQQGHSISDSKLRVKVYSEVERFLEKNLFLKPKRASE